MTSLIKGYGSWSETGEGVDFSKELMVVFSNELEKGLTVEGVWEIWEWGSNGFAESWQGKLFSWKTTFLETSITFVCKLNTTFLWGLKPRKTQGRALGSDFFLYATNVLE